jgi:carbamoyltransferase
MSIDVLGISAFYHDAAAALVRDGSVIAAVQEERYSRKKHDPRFPKNAINYCLEEGELDPSALDAVVFYDHPALTLDRVVKSFLSVAPRGAEQWSKAITSMVGVKAHISEHISGFLKCDVPVFFTRHHMAHAASAFFPSPFEDAAIMTVDGVGEWATLSLADGHGKDIEVLKEIHYPHSLGLLYSAFTYYCGFKVNSGEYKLMGLAPYGEPRYVDLILEKLIDLKDDGSFVLNTEFFGYLDSNKMVNDRFSSLFGGPPREPESKISTREMDLAASIQRVTELVVMALARHAREATGRTRLTLAGGVALNCVANGRLLREGVFDDIWIQPAAGDAGGALGAALYASYQLFDIDRRVSRDGSDSQQGSYLGPRFSRDEIQAFLERHDLPYEEFNSGVERSTAVAKAIADGLIVGHFSGRMEFGPRALGSRSILGDPRRADTQTQMNLKIKYRESFRPFAPTVLEECVSDYFDLDRRSPYMLLVAPVREERRLLGEGLSDANLGDDLLEIVRRPRSDIPAVTHVDYSARVQTISRDDHSEYYDVVRAFQELTGCGVVVNTSFNVRGEPIVCSPQDAYKCFMRTEMDVLVLENFLLRKSEQPKYHEDVDWRSEYELD